MKSMAESNVDSGVPETDITALKEALCAQQNLLQKLYAELDAERESSATAVSEALSMILRLQGEKSAMMMEASQYKRMTEEELSHAEETLAIYEDMMYQKEMEISALEFQVQAYKCKLLSLGCDDLGGDDLDTGYHENLSLLRKDFEMGSNIAVRKLKSLPPSTRARSLNASDKVLKILEEKADQEVDDQSLVLRKNSEKSATGGGDFESYWEQIRKLDERVKELADYNGGCGGRDNKSTNLKGTSLLSQSSTYTSTDLTRRYEISPMFDQLKDSTSAHDERKEVVGSVCSSHVYDIYEVRDITEDCKQSTNEEEKKKQQQQKKIVWEGENRLGKPDPVVEEVLESHFEEDESEVLKPMLLGAIHEKKIRPCNTTTRDASVECKLSLIEPKIDFVECHEPVIQQLNQRIEHLEAAERICTSQEIVSVGGEDQMNLLREIRQQLDSIKLEMTSLKKPRKSSQHEDSCLVSLKEALLHFWF